MIEEVDNIVKLVYTNDKRENYENNLVIEIKDLIYSYEGKINIASAFGCLKLVEADLIRELL